MIFKGKYKGYSFVLVPTDFTDDIGNVMNRYFKLYVPIWLATAGKEYSLKNLNCLNSAPDVNTSKKVCLHRNSRPFLYKFKIRCSIINL